MNQKVEVGQLIKVDSEDAFVSIIYAKVKKSRLFISKTGSSLFSQTLS